MTTVTGLPLRPPPPPPEPLLAGVPGLANPGDFDDLEYNHSFRVQENDGLSLMLISMVGRAPQAKDEDTGGPPPEKEPLMLQLQYDLNPGGGDAAFVINDTKSPVRTAHRGRAGGLGRWEGQAVDTRWLTNTSVVRYANAHITPSVSRVCRARRSW